MPHKDIVKPHEGSQGETSIAHKGLNKHSNQLCIIFAHYVLEKLVIFQVIDKGNLLVKRIVENAQFWLDTFLQKLELLNQIRHP